MKPKFVSMLSILPVIILALSACGRGPTETSTVETVRLIADRTSLHSGECTFLRWEVIGGFGVTLNSEQVDKVGQREVCPAETLTYLLAVDMGTHMETRQVVVHVGGGGQALGPTPVTPGVPAYQSGATWLRLGGPPGGLGYDIRMQPDSPDIMYVTDAFAGFHKSTDGGQSWLPINQSIETSAGAGSAAFSLTIDPHDYSSIWGGLQLSGHIYHSDDAGQTWQQRDNGLLFEDCLRSVRGITVDPNDQNTVYAGVEVDSLCWSDHVLIGRQGIVRGEVYKSTDGGGNWARIWEGDNLARYIWVDPRNSSRIYVSTGLFDRDAANSDVPNGVWGGVGILRSDDGGQTWKVLDEDNGLGGLYVPSLFMHPQNPDILLAAVTYPADPGGEGAYVTYDGGDTWQRIVSVDQGMGMDAVEISTSDPDVWYASAENVIYRSDDAGLTWTGPMDMSTPDRHGGVPIDLQVDPRDPFRIFQNAYGGGNMVSTDGGATWADASSGYTGVRVHPMFVLPGSSGSTVFANGFRTEDAGLTWPGIGFDGRAFAGYTDDDGYHLIAAALYGGVHLSDDGGSTWEEVQVADTGGLPLSVALAQAPSEPQTLYLAHFHWNCPLIPYAYGPCLTTMPGTLRSEDGGKTWARVSDPANGLSVLSMAVHPDDPLAVYAATADGLYHTRDGGQSWQRDEAFTSLAMGVPILDADLLGGITQPIVFDIAFDPFDANVIYVSAKPAGIIISTDGGQSWRQSASGMDPNEPTADILPDPNHQGVIYVASRLSGVFLSTDGGTTWRQIVEGLARKDGMVLALSEDSSVLYLGTASGNGGAGVWRLGTPGVGPEGQ